MISMTADDDFYEEGFEAIDKALEEGLDLYADCSGSGSIIVSIETPDGDVEGYGRHFHLSPALNIAGRDYAEGSRPDSRALTGTSDVENAIHRYLLQSSRLHATQEEDRVRLELFDYEDDLVGETEQPTFGEAYDYLKGCDKLAE